MPKCKSSSSRKRSFPLTGPVFCDYCDVYLTHDSMSVRKAHNSGRNHLRNVVDYYQRTSPPSFASPLPLSLILSTQKSATKRPNPSSTA